MDTKLVFVQSWVRDPLNNCTFSFLFAGHGGDAYRSDWGSFVKSKSSYNSRSGPSNCRKKDKTKCIKEIASTNPLVSWTINVGRLGRPNSNEITKPKLSFADSARYLQLKIILQMIYLILLTKSYYEDSNILRAF